MKVRAKLLIVLLSAPFFSGSTAPAPVPRPSANKFDSSPFAVGEKLVYAVEWNPPWYLFFLPTMDAGEAELSLAGETVYGGKRAVKIIFQARSSGTLVKLSGVKIDDHFEFITDPETFCTCAVKKKLREGKRKRDIDVVYDRQQRRLHIRETDLGVSPPKLKRDEFVKDIPECVRDLFSALYNARRRDLSMGDSHRSMVGDNDRVKEIETQVEKRETVETPKGKYDAWKLNTVSILGGLFKDGGQFKIWLSADERKIPVQFEAKVSLGKVSGKLKEVQP